MVVPALIHRAGNTLLEVLGIGGWVRLTCAAGICMIVGHLAASLAGFPQYEGYQGVAAQQPWAVIGPALVMSILAVLLGTLLSLPVVPTLEARLAPAAGLTALAGFSLRGGTMTSVLHAADGRGVYWSLAGELLALGIVAVAGFAIFQLWWPQDTPSSSDPKEEDAPSDVPLAAIIQSVVIQVIITTLAIAILGQSTQKGQAMFGVCAASLVGAWTAHWLAGCLWTYAWSVPIAIGILGYGINALTVTGVETADLHGLFSGLAMPLPLDYVSMGPIGVLLGLIAGRHSGEEQENSTTTEKAKA